MEVKKIIKYTLAMLAMLAIAAVLLILIGRLDLFFFGIYALIYIVPMGLIFFRCNRFFVMYKIGIYTKIAVTILIGSLIGVVISFILIGGVGGVYFVLYSLLIIAPIGFIAFLVAAIKERTALSFAGLLVLIWPVVSMFVPFLASSVDDYMTEKKNEMTESELIDAYENISGKRPLCLLHLSPHKKDNVFLLDVARIDCDTIGNGEILLQYERAKLRTSNSTLKSSNINNIDDQRDVELVHYIPCDNGYKIRYNVQHSFFYRYENGNYFMDYETNDYKIGWREVECTDYAHYGIWNFTRSNLLKYYEEHKSEIPVIAAEEITKNRTHVKYTKYADGYHLIFKTRSGYDELTEYLQEQHGAVIFDISEDDGKRMASVKIGESVMELSCYSYDSSLEGKLSDMPMMEQIAEDFESYITDNNLDRFINDTIQDGSEKKHTTPLCDTTNWDYW